MILANLTKAIREQNYYAVVLEFLIVIAGVVIGFQITAWNEGRAQQDLAEVLTARLAEDVQQERQTVLETLSYYRVVLENAERVSHDFEGSAQVDDETFLIAGFRATQFPGFPRFRSAYDELTSTGTIPLVSDDGLRRISVMLYDPGIYNRHLSDSGDSIYRDRFRSLVPAALQRQLREDCGDIFTPAPPGGVESLVLDYPCELNANTDLVTQTVARLRGDTTLNEALQLRIADLDTMLNNLNDFLLTFESLLGDRFPQEGTAQ